MKSRRAIFVDFDGTLVDSEVSISLAYSAALKEFGFNVSPKKVLRFSKGVHWSIFLPQIIGKAYSAEIGLQIAKYKKIIYPQYFSSVRLNISLVEMLKTMKPNFLVGIVTSATREGVESILTNHNLNNFFDAIVCQEDVNKPKPDPMGYFLGMELLNVTPENSICFEDSEAGIKAAKSAGLQVFKVLGI
jgi:beta-phosphoglucomutase